MRKKHKVSYVYSLTVILQLHDVPCRLQQLLSVVSHFTVILQLHNVPCRLQQLLSVVSHFSDSSSMICPVRIQQFEKLVSFLSWSMDLLMNSLAIWLSSHHPSVLWCCRLGYLTHKIVAEMTYNVPSGWLTVIIQWYSSVGWVIWPIKSSPYVAKKCSTYWISYTSQWVI